jgi:hypothetical protein
VVDYEEESVDLFFVAFGRLRVTIRPISGGEIILRDVRDDEFFGELVALDGRPRSAGVVAITDSVIAYDAVGAAPRANRVGVARPLGRGESQTRLRGPAQTQ